MITLGGDMEVYDDEYEYLCSHYERKPNRYNTEWSKNKRQTLNTKENAN